MSTNGGSSTLRTVRIKKETQIQTNGLENPVKLSSFSVPRDLTLGGTGIGLRGGRGASNKKVYAPNLNVTRNKNTAVKTSRDTTTGRGRPRSERGKSDRGGRGGRGRGGNLIQTAGLFSEGAGAELHKRAFSSSRYSSGGSSTRDETEAIRKPTLIKQETKFDTAAEKQQLNDILGDEEDSNEEFNLDKTDLDYVPVKLSEEKWNLRIKQEDMKSEIKMEIEEPKQDGNEVFGDKLNLPKIKKEFLTEYPLSIEEYIVRPQEQKLFLLQLPDSLPCQDSMKSKEEEQPHSSNKDQSTDNTSEEDDIFKGTSLRDLNEGQIGKVVRYKSGKHKLILGSNTIFDLDLGMNSGFLQDVMSITTNREERNGNMINIGTIQAKLIAIPDWENFFKDTS